MARLLTQSFFLLQVITTLFLSPSLTNAGPIGKITEQTGPAEIVRNKKSNPSSVNSPLESNDTVITAKASAKLSFEDNTTVKMTEQSKLVIDDFVYDPNKGTGKLAMKVALGTARYASGQIAKTNPQQVAVNTPTATIAVRGTDFSMTVDELGRSLIILLPSCDEKSCVTGAISVKNDAGEVYLDTPYQSTYVTGLSTPPSAPAILKIDQSSINNLLIVSPPQKEEIEDFKTQNKTAIDINYLDKNMFGENKLDVDELKKFKELDVNLLDVNLLVNMIDLANQQMFTSFEQLAGLNQLLPNYSEITGIRYFFNDDESKVTLTRNLRHIAEVTVPVSQDSMIIYNQDGLVLSQKVNGGGTTTITIIQK